MHLDRTGFQHWRDNININRIPVHLKASIKLSELNLIEPKSKQNAVGPGARLENGLLWILWRNIRAGIPVVNRCLRGWSIIHTLKESLRKLRRQGTVFSECGNAGQTYQWKTVSTVIL